MLYISQRYCYTRYLTRMTNKYPIFTMAIIVYNIIFEFIYISKLHLEIKVMIFGVSSLLSNAYSLILRAKPTKSYDSKLYI